MRFWGVMEMLQKHETVNKRLLVVTLFNQNAEELEVLLAANIISLVNEKFPDSIGKKSDTIFSLLNSSLDSVALTAGNNIYQRRKKSIFTILQIYYVYW